MKHLASIAIPFLTMGLVQTFAATISLSEMDLSAVRQGWGNPGKNLSVSGQPLRLDGKTFSSGIGTHSPSAMVIELDGQAEKFTALCGLDDNAGNDRGSVRFLVMGDGQILWKSPVQRIGAPATQVSINLQGVRQLALLVSDAGDGDAYDHANWVNPVITYSGKRPAPAANLAEEKTILTPPPPPQPRINSPAVFGVRPGSPFFYTIAASGTKPVTFSAEHLPAGLSLDPATGIITGQLASPGSHTVTLRAKNTAGTAEKKLTIHVGDKIALTPPMGWNSWYCWSESVGQQHIKDAAAAMKKSGLADYGWSYVVIDDCWQGARSGPLMAIQPNDKFADMAGLANHVHRLGLRIGIYSSPWMGTYAGFIGSSAPNKEGDYSQYAIPANQRGSGLPTQLFGSAPGILRLKIDRVGPVWFMDKDARQWAEWGFDFVKIDWWLPDTQPLKNVYESVSGAPRDIVLSLSNAADFSQAEKYPRHSNMWRTTGDIYDAWGSISEIGFSQLKWQPHLAPGAWPDPDMLQVGRFGKVNQQNTQTHPTRLSSNEQYTQVTLWSMLQAPLMLSCDITALDDFTKGLLTNTEVLAINQDPSAQPARMFSQSQDLHTEIWVKPLADGSLAVAFFNRHEIPLDMSISLRELLGDHPAKVRDCWRQKDVATPGGNISVKVGRHGSALFRVSPR